MPCQPFVYWLVEDPLLEKDMKVSVGNRCCIYKRNMQKLCIDACHTNLELLMGCLLHALTPALQ